MSKIELVIKIPEDSYKATCNGCMLPPDVENVVNAIRNGTLLPKGHGELKDVDIIHKEIERLQSGIAKNGGAVNIRRDQYKGMCYARGIINEALTIIEADGGGEE